MLETIYQTAVRLITSWGYWGLLAGMALESACMPVPSEIVLPFGGYLVSQGILKFWPTVGFEIAGQALGSITAYLVGIYGGRPFIQRYGRYFLINQNDLDRADQLFEKYGTKIVFWARFIPVVRTFISLPAGIARMNFVRFLVYTILGAVPWTIFFTYLGLKLGQNWAHVRAMFEQFDMIIIVLLIILVAVWLGGRLRNRKDKRL